MESNLLAPPGAFRNLRLWLTFYAAKRRHTHEALQRAFAVYESGKPATLTLSLDDEQIQHLGFGHLSNVSNASALHPASLGDQDSSARSDYLAYLVCEFGSGDRCYFYVPHAMP